MGTQVLKQRIPKNIGNNIYPYILITPFFIISILFLFIPIVLSVYYSVLDINFLNISNSTFVGLENFKSIFSNEEYWQSIANIINLLIIIIPVTTIISFSLALLAKDNRKSSMAMRTIFYLPYILTPVAIASVMSILFGKDGFLTLMSSSILGTSNIAWNTSVDYATWLIIFTIIWVQVGFYMILYITAMNNIPKELYEAAEIDGAGKLKQLLYVTIPQVKNTTFMVVFMIFITTVQQFDIPFIISTIGNASPGSPEGTTLTPVMYIYDQALNKNNTGMASAATVILVLFMIVIAIVQFKVSGGKDEE
ncbi:MAG: carbohydrate ABC transporter permease [Coprobacillaceae bacterium]